ncbi:DUF1127 domain-containing protein [Pikeienuella piscinae]|uniref:DUF1127 domain-containing protein n=1 Tax=Pikeienuella piscinae TaxID=2748098 RepID=A0A7L5BWW7_9RHOB|nr:DUF1127 domain-containing protein [Pikeienuella piscinae]QIE55318.1 DUF1127 domain-containing protein [Pikeienuella piscinae]
MAYITDTNAAATHRGESALVAALTRLVARFNAWRSYRATYRALSALSDAELNDIGLTRGEIARVSRDAI